MTSPVAPAGQSVDAAAWNGAYLRFEDLGAVLPGQPSPLVAQLARELSGVRRSADGRHFRRRLGWRAERGRLVVVEMDQPLGRRDDGRFAPIGGWSITDVRVHPARDVARRIGDVPEDPPPPVSFPGAPGATGPEGDGLGRDETDVRYLPRDVRSGFVAALPRPTLAVAEAVRFSEGDRVTHHVVNALRLDDGAAVVITATRPAGSRRWRVEQASYRLAGPAIGGRGNLGELAR
ncbi:MAG: hypothetical protein LCH77_01475 [Actinobacteria bacterium]|nr:hypothetical protein [Actinomycetota bacterium]